MHVASQRARSQAGASSLSDAEAFTVRQELAQGLADVDHKKHTFHEFADVLFVRAINGRDPREFWSSVNDKADLVVERSDMAAILDKLEHIEKEEDMYPLWEKAGEIIILCALVSPGQVVPDPYYIEEEGNWIKSPAVEAWNSPQVGYRLVNMHSFKPTGLDSGTRYVRWTFPPMLIGLTLLFRLDMLLMRGTTLAQALEWSRILVVFEMKSGLSKSSSKVTTDRKTTSSLPASTIADKYRNTSPYTTKLKDGHKPTLHRRMQGAGYAANVLSASMPFRTSVPIAIVTGLRVELSVLDHANVFTGPELAPEHGFRALVALIIASTTCGSHALGFEPSLVPDDQYPSQWGDITLQGILPTTANFSSLTPATPFDVRLTGPNLAERPIPIPESTLDSVGATDTIPTRPLREVFGPATCVREGVIQDAEGSTRHVAVKIAWASGTSDHLTELETILRMNKLGVSNMTQIIGYKVLRSLAEAGSFRARFLAAFRQLDLHPEVDNRFLYVIVMSTIVVPLARVKELGSFQRGLLSMLEGVI